MAADPEDVVEAYLVRTLGSLVLLFMLPGCCAPHSRDDHVVVVLAALDRIDTRLAPDEDYAAYQSRVWAEVRREVRRIEEPRQLYELAVVCNDRRWQEPAGDQEHLAETGANLEGLWAAVTALGDLKCEGSARLLVKLLEDHRFSWDGEGGYCIGNAIITCGDLSIPYLKRVRDPCRVRFAESIQGWIREGRRLP